MFKAKEGINIGGKVVTGTGPTAVLTVGDVGSLAFQNAEGAAIDYLIVNNKLGIGYGVEAPTYEFDMIMSKPGTSLVGRIYNKSTTANSVAKIQMVTGTANNYLELNFNDTVGGSLWVGTGAPTMHYHATTHQFKVQSGATNVLQIADGQVTLQNGTSNKIKFGNVGVAAPTFTTYSAGVKHVLYDSIGASDAGICIGVASASLFQNVRNTTDTFTWYGGTTLAATLTGAGNLTLVGDLTVSGGDITVTNITAGNVASTLFAGNTTTNITIGGALTSGNLNLGLSTATGYVNLYSVSGMRVPTGTTAQQPVAATAGGGTIRYNSTTFQFEGVSGSTPTWLPLGGATISDDVATNATYYPIIATTTSGVATTVKTSSSKLTFNPSTGVMSVAGLTLSTTTGVTTPNLIISSGTGQLYLTTRNTGTSWVQYVDSGIMRWYKTAATAGDRLTLTEAGDLTATGAVTAFSDRRLKRDLVRIGDALNKIEWLTGYTYSRIDTGSVETGLIAQDVQAVLPEAIKESQDGILSIAYGNLMGLMVEGIKELRREVELLKTRIG